jgi:hypothetical protein
MLSSVLLAVCGPQLTSYNSMLCDNSIRTNRETFLELQVLLNNCKHRTAAGTKFLNNFVHRYSSIHADRFFCSIFKNFPLYTLSVPFQDSDNCYSISESRHTIINYFLGRDKCRHIGVKRSEMNLYCVHHIWPKNLIPPRWYSLVHCNKRAAILKRVFLSFK